MAWFWAMCGWWKHYFYVRFYCISYLLRLFCKSTISEKKNIAQPLTKLPANTCKLGGKRPYNIFSRMHLKICSWWPLLSSTDSFLTSHNVQYAFSLHRNSQIHFLKICTLWHLVTFIPPPPQFQTNWNYIRIPPLYCPKSSYWNFEISFDFYLKINFSFWGCT